MDRRKRNLTALGLLVVGSALVFLWGFYFLLGTPVVGGGRKIYVLLEDGAGLKRGDRVQLQGVQVGSVSGVELRSANRVVATLRLSAPLPLPADTRAAVRGDVFGAHSMDLIPGTALVKLDAGDTIRGESAPALPDLALELSAQARRVLGGADSLLNPEVVRGVHLAASTLPASAQELQAVLTELHGAAASLRRSARAAEDARSGATLGAALAEVERSARSLAAAAASMDRSMASLASVLAKVDAGEGTLGRLVNDTTLYRDMQSAAREMAALATDVRRNPKRYITVKVF
ncbi:MAG: MCE family protein [Gemmatimonadetes bacterium]|nr:MCE family protein [Gemmatimonadota bacterium]